SIPTRQPSPELTLMPMDLTKLKSALGGDRHAILQRASCRVRTGATVMFSENTEVRDGIDQLTSRAADSDRAQALIDELAWYDRYLERGGVDRSANTTPGNRKGGLANIVEKAMGVDRQVWHCTDCGRGPVGRAGIQKGAPVCANAC